MGGALFLCSFDAIQVAGQAAVGTAAMGALQETVTFQICQRPLHGTAGQLQILRDPADAGPAGIPCVRPILEVHIDCPCPMGQLHVGVDASKVAPIIFDPFNNDYLKVGEKVGKAFSDGKALK